MAKSDDKDNKIPVNRYGRDFSSQIRDIKIYLPVQDDKEENEDENNFVGRERVMERLYQWLVGPGRGSYLVTGFRGMGKSTIVRKVTDRLTKKTDSKYSAIFFFIVSFVVLLPFCLKFNYAWILLATILIVIVMCCIDKDDCGWDADCADCYNTNNPLNFDKESLDKIGRGKKPDNSKQEFNRIKLEINLGHEVLHERDILSLIATNIKKEYSRYVKSLQPPSHSVIAVVFALTVGILSH